MKKILSALIISFFVLFFVKVDSFAYDVPSFGGRVFHFADGSNHALVNTSSSYGSYSPGLYMVSDFPFSYTQFFSTKYVNISTSKGIYFVPVGSYETWKDEITESVIFIDSLADFVFSSSEFDESLEIIGFTVHKAFGTLDTPSSSVLGSPWCYYAWQSVTDNVDHVVVKFWDTDSGDIEFNPASRFMWFSLPDYLSEGAMLISATPYDSSGNYGPSVFASIGYGFQKVTDIPGYKLTTDYDGEPIDVNGKDPVIIYKTVDNPFSKPSVSSGNTSVINENNDTYIYNIPNDFNPDSIVDIDPFIIPVIIPAPIPEPDNTKPIPSIPDPSAPSYDIKYVSNLLDGYKESGSILFRFFGSMFPMLDSIPSWIVLVIGIVVSFAFVCIVIKIVGAIL